MLRMMVLATLIGAVCTTLGLFASYALSTTYDVQIPTGPLIILIAVALYVVSSGVRAGAGRLHD